MGSVPTEKIHQLSKKEDGGYRRCYLDLVVEQKMVEKDFTAPYFRAGFQLNLESD